MLPNEKKDLHQLKTDFDENGVNRITPKLLRDFLVSSIGSRAVTDIADSQDLDENMDVIAVSTQESGCYVRLPKRFLSDPSGTPFANKMYTVFNIGKFAINILTYPDDVFHDGTQSVSVPPGSVFDVHADVEFWLWKKAGGTNISESTEDFFQNAFMGKTASGSNMPDYQSEKIVSADDSLVTAITKLDAVAGIQKMSILAKYPISGHRLVEVDSTGKFVYSQSGNAVALTLGACDIDEIVDVINTGMVEEPSWNWVSGQPIYQTGLGMLTQTVPTSGFIRQVATALSPTSLFLEFKQTIIIG